MSRKSPMKTKFPKFIPRRATRDEYIDMDIAREKAAARLRPDVAPPSATDRAASIADLNEIADQVRADSAKAAGPKRPTPTNPKEEQQ